MMKTADEFEQLMCDRMEWLASNGRTDNEDLIVEHIQRGYSALQVAMVPPPKHRRFGAVREAIVYLMAATAILDEFLEMEENENE